MERKLSLGIDIGSTTTKLVLIDGETVLYEKYQRHLSRVRQTTLEMLREMQNENHIDEVSVTVSGSAGMGMADAAVSPKELGKRIVVQGGTFYNDAVFRAFEKEIGAEVIRPSIAGLMGAYGAAIHSMHIWESTLLSEDGLKNFTHESATAVCKGCANHCNLTVNRFSDGKRYIDP